MAHLPVSLDLSAKGNLRPCQFNERVPGEGFSWRTRIRPPILQGFFQIKAKLYRRKVVRLNLES
jgi:hypothetical protein